MRGRFTGRLVLVAGVLLGAFIVPPSGPTGARAPGPAPADFRISGELAIADEWGPAVAYNSADDEYLVVWTDLRKSSSRGWDVFGQRISAAGELLGPNFVINEKDAPGDQYAPAVAYNSFANQYFVVWTDLRYWTEWDEQVNVFGQRIRADGRLAGSNIWIDDWVEGYSPDVAYNTATNQYLVVWADFRASNQERGAEIWGQRVRSGGRMAGDNFRIGVSRGGAPPDFQSQPDVACNSSRNQFLVVWHDGRDTTTRADIFGQRVKGGGRLAGGNFRISDPGLVGSEYNPTVAHDPNLDRYLVVWRDARKDSTRGTDIFGQRIKGGGRLAGGNIPLSDDGATADEDWPEVAFDTRSNRYLVVWEDERNSTIAGSDVYAQRVKGGGRLFGSNLRLPGGLVRPSSDEVAPGVAYGNEYLIVWQDERSYDTRGWEVYGEFFSG